MGRGVPEYVLAFLIGKGVELDGRVAVEHVGQIDRYIVHGTSDYLAGDQTSLTRRVIDGQRSVKGYLFFGKSNGKHTRYLRKIRI